jgi:hypothetical protein
MSDVSESGCVNVRGGTCAAEDRQVASDSCTTLLLATSSNPESDVETRRTCEFWCDGEEDGS